MDQIQAMRIFARVVEAGTFTRAADSLQLPKATVTKHVQALEARLREVLSPTQLEVIDESHQHAGHAGANGTGFGTHFHVHLIPRFQSDGFWDQISLAQVQLDLTHFLKAL